MHKETIVDAGRADDRLEAAKSVASEIERREQLVKRLESLPNPTDSEVEKLVGEIKELSDALDRAADVEEKRRQMIHGQKILDRYADALSEANGLRMVASRAGTQLLTESLEGLGVPLKIDMHGEKPRIVYVHPKRGDVL